MALYKCCIIIIIIIIIIIMWNLKIEKMLDATIFNGILKMRS